MSVIKERLETPRQLGRRTTLIVVVVLLAVLLLVTVWEHRLATKVEDAPSAVAAAGSQIEKLLSYTPTTVTSDLDDETKLLVGDFASEYENLVRNVIAPAAVEAGVVTEATVSKSAVVSFDRSSIEALMFVTVVTSSTESAEPRINGSRLLVEITHDGGEWKIASFDPI